MRKLQKYFYSHLLYDNDLEAELDSLDITSGEKDELLELSHIHVHQTVMDAILSELTDTDKKRFLELMAEGKDEKIWEHLNKKIEKIEDKITIVAKQIKEEMKEDIKKIKSSR